MAPDYDIVRGMATYLDLRDLFHTGTDLAKRMDVGVIVAAELIRDGDDTAANGFDDSDPAHHLLRKTWARDAFGDTAGIAREVLKAVLAQNRALTVEQIEGASDSGLQTAVNKAVDLLAGV